MVAKVTFEVGNCTECPFHDQRHGIYCLKTDRLICKENEYANVPGWCPFILGTYEGFISDILSSYDWRSYLNANTCNPKNLKNLVFNRGAAHAKNTIQQGCDFLDLLDQNSFGTFVYDGRTHSVERDKYLLTIAALVRDLGAYESRKKQAENSAEIAEREFLSQSDFSDEDKEIIIDAILNWQHGEILMREFNETRRRLKSSRKKPVLDTKTAIKIALYLADVLDVGKERVTERSYYACRFGHILYPLAESFKCVEKVELKLTHTKNVKNVMELHYTVNEGFDVDSLKLWPELITIPRDVAKDFLGLRSFKFFVNNEEINLRRITSLVLSSDEDQT